MKFTLLQRPLNLLAALFLLALMSLAQAAEITQGEVNANGVRHVNAQQAAEILEQRSDVVVIDVRTPREFSSERIKGAINIDYYADDFADQLRALDPEKTYLLHCRSGVRSGKSVPILQSIGFSKLIHLDGGMKAWESSGNQVQK